MSQQKTVDIGNNTQVHLFVNGIPQPPQPNPDPNPNPNPSNNGVGPDGVIEIVKSNTSPKCPALYIDLSKGDPSSENGPFCITYGHDVVKSTIVKGTNGKTCLETKGHVQTYASGNEPGMSMRAHWFPDGKAFDTAKYKWDDKPKPKFLLTEKTFYSYEMTAIIEDGDPLGTHQSHAFKMRARNDQPNDDWRSTVECCFTNSQKSKPYFNYNFKHKGYEGVDGVVQFAPCPKATPNKPIGYKIVSVVLSDDSAVIYQWWVDENPINADGSLRNQYVLVAQYVAKGIPAYQNIIETWGGQTYYFRNDGFKNFRIYAFSIREVDVNDFVNRLYKHAQTLQGETLTAEKINVEEHDPVADVGISPK